ncbi:hypothetical protein FIBSPDRAFT_872404 [Athelia psychrophila]|uniref:F-box domain-containing protein n=1 Tax=Athelia psychrophila TaxID=1759441 RepID=A0A165ZLM5_9AGAM|nr:hypothetical protein FIBSPDRAFT_872404 [Fibularhizoctonia sp. CBS 109695]
MLQRERPPIEVLLSQISHHWRNVALGTPKLWSRIDMLKFASLYLQRSKAVPFTLDLPATSTYFSIGDVRDDEVVREALEQLPLHLGRCRSLKFHCNDQREMALFMPCLAASSAPSLLSLQLLCRSSQSHNSEYKYVYHGGFPAMSNLHLCNVHLKPFYAALRAVTTLDFTVTRPLRVSTLSELCDALNSAPSLKTFKFHGDTPDAWTWQPPVGISTPSLRSLSINTKTGSVICGLLRIIHAPSLSQLNLNNVPAQALADFPEGPAQDALPKFPLLYKLEIGALGFDPRRIMEAFPTVQELVLGQFANNIEQFLALLRIHAHWPLLCTLTIPSGSSLDILQKVSLAQEAMGRPIKKLKLYPGLLRQVERASKAEGSVFRRTELASLARSSSEY